MDTRTQENGLIAYIPDWWPIEPPTYSPLSQDDRMMSARDQESCIDIHRGIRFEDEAFAVATFIRCMHTKGWRWDYHEILIVRH